MRFMMLVKANKDFEAGAPLNPELADILGPSYEGELEIRRMFNAKLPCPKVTGWVRTSVPSFGKVNYSCGNELAYRVKTRIHCPALSSISGSHIQHGNPVMFPGSAQAKERYSLRLV